MTVPDLDWRQAKLHDCFVSSLDSLDQAPTHLEQSAMFKYNFDKRLMHFRNWVLV